MSIRKFIFSLAVMCLGFATAVTAGTVRYTGSSDSPTIPATGGTLGISVVNNPTSITITN